MASRADAGSAGPLSPFSSPTRNQTRYSPMISVRTVLSAAGFLSLMACGSAGPDLRGPQGPGLMSAYSGEWQLLRLESDNLREKMSDARGAPGGAQGGMPRGRGGGGMTGVRPGGGGMPGGGRGGARGGTLSGLSPEEMRAALAGVRALAAVPDEMTITLDVEAVTLASLNQALLSLTLNAEEAQRLHQGEVEFSAWAKWTKKGIEIERETAEGFAVRDELSIDEMGRLVMKREVLLMSRSVEAKLVYGKGTP